MSDSFHKTDGALLGSCGDMRHAETEAMGLAMSYQGAQIMAAAVQAFGQGVDGWRKNRQARFEQRESALTDHDDVNALLAARRARQAQEQEAAPRPVFTMKYS